MALANDCPALVKPALAGTLQLDPPRLLGSRCDTCDMLVFPSRDFCPRCSGEAVREAEPLSPEGSIFSHTVVRQAPGGRPVPYVLAYIDLDCGVRVLSAVECGSQDIAIGKRAGLVLAPDEDGCGYAFALLGQTDEEPGH